MNAAGIPPSGSGQEQGNRLLHWRKESEGLREGRAELRVFQQPPKFTHDSWPSPPEPPKTSGSFNSQENQGMLSPCLAQGAEFLG